MATPSLEVAKPKVFKMAGVWLWVCHHGAPCGDEFRDKDYRDSWTAAVVTAVKHYVEFHYVADQPESSMPLD